MNGWHKCHLCDCEFFDPDLDGYWGWCPGCRERKNHKEANQHGTLQETEDARVRADQLRLKD